MCVCFEMVDGLLPVGCENLSRRPSQALVDLDKTVSKMLSCLKHFSSAVTHV